MHACVAVIIMLGGVLICGGHCPCLRLLRRLRLLRLHCLLRLLRLLLLRLLLAVLALSLVVLFLIFPWERLAKVLAVVTMGFFSQPGALPPSQSRETAPTLGVAQLQRVGGQITTSADQRRLNEPQVGAPHTQRLLSQLGAVEMYEIALLRCDVLDRKAALTVEVFARQAMEHHALVDHGMFVPVLGSSLEPHERRPPRSGKLVREAPLLTGRLRHLCPVAVPLRSPVSGVPVLPVRVVFPERRCRIYKAQVLTLPAARFEVARRNLGGSKIEYVSVEVA